MSDFVQHTVLGNELLLSAERCIYWEKEKTLIMSDLHLGKTGHFRKSGIAVPQQIFKEDMHRLLAMIQFYKPERLIIVGDLFHSTMNRELDFFLKWRNDLSHIRIDLVKGNHDILKREWYTTANIDVHECELRVGDFLFVHDLLDCDLSQPGYVISGHIHPSITISGLGRQSLTFPCFYFSNKYAVLPAFSLFTGSFGLTPKVGDQVFALMQKKLMRIQ